MNHACQLFVNLSIWATYVTDTNQVFDEMPEWKKKNLISFLKFSFVEYNGILWLCFYCWKIEWCYNVGIDAVLPFGE